MGYGGVHIPRRRSRDGISCIPPLTLGPFLPCPFPPQDHEKGWNGYGWDNDVFEFRDRLPIRYCLVVIPLDRQMYFRISTNSYVRCISPKPGGHGIRIPGTGIGTPGNEVHTIGVTLCIVIGVVVITVQVIADNIIRIIKIGEI